MTLGSQRHVHLSGLEVVHATHLQLAHSRRQINRHLRDEPCTFRCIEQVPRFQLLRRAQRSSHKSIIQKTLHSHRVHQSRMNWRMTHFHASAPLIVDVLAIGRRQGRTTRDLSRQMEILILIASTIPYTSLIMELCCSIILTRHV